MRVTKNNICSAIKKETGLSVSIHTTNGYFFFYSDDYVTDLMLSSLESTSVYFNILSHQSVSDWVRCFKDMINKE